jgi:hypothetical protein
VRAKRDVSPGGSVSKFTAHGSATNLQDTHIFHSSEACTVTLLLVSAVVIDTHTIALSMAGDSLQLPPDVPREGAHLKLCRWGMLAMSRQKGAYSLPLGYCVA